LTINAVGQAIMFPIFIWLMLSLHFIEYKIM